MNEARVFVFLRHEANYLTFSFSFPITALILTISGLYKTLDRFTPVDQALPTFSPPSSHPLSLCCPLLRSLLL